MLLLRKVALISLVYCLALVSLPSLVSPSRLSAQAPSPSPVILTLGDSCQPIYSIRTDTVLGVSGFHIVPKAPGASAIFFRLWCHGVAVRADTINTLTPTAPVVIAGQDTLLPRNLSTWIGQHFQPLIISNSDSAHVYVTPLAPADSSMHYAMPAIGDTLTTWNHLWQRPALPLLMDTRVIASPSTGRTLPVGPPE
jgi:hypothetical protein